jgi:hypothetical protein
LPQQGTYIGIGEVLAGGMLLHHQPQRIECAGS